MKKDKNTLNNLSQKELVPSNGSGSGLAMGLSLGVLFGIVTDNIGLGVMLGVAVALHRSGNQRAEEKQES